MVLLPMNTYLNGAQTKLDINLPEEALKNINGAQKLVVRPGNAQSGDWSYDLIPEGSNPITEEAVATFSVPNAEPYELFKPIMQINQTINMQANTPVPAMFTPSF